MAVATWPLDVEAVAEALVKGVDGVPVAFVGDVINFHDFEEEVFVFGSPVGEGLLSVPVRHRRVSADALHSIGNRRGIKGGALIWVRD